MAFELQAKTKTTPALKLDEILEQIFVHLDNCSLLTCRLVCRQWRSAATPQLRKRIQIHLYDFKLGAPDSSKNNQENKSLDDLSNLLEQSEAFNSLFPCNNFSFTETLSGDAWANLSDAGFQNFLYSHGPGHIKELSLTSSGKRTPRGYHTYCPHESAVMQQVENLLLNQTPNLNTLTLNIESEIDWKDKDYSAFEYQKQIPLQVTDEEYHEIHEKFLSLPSSSRNTSLKVFKIGNELSAKVFEIVILLCPNLQEIIFEDETFLAYIIEPVNRLGLLKTLEFDLSPWNFKTLEKIASILQQQEQGDLKLRRFTISLLDFQINRAQSLGAFDSALEDRVVCVINQILERSADSLETFAWHEMTYLKRLKLPASLPKVTRLELTGQRLVKRFHSCPSDFFNLSTRFPNLHHLSMQCSTESDYEKLLYLFNPSGYLPVLSVKTVDINVDKYSGRGNLSAEMLERVRDLFPNASVKNIYIEVST